MSVAVKLDEKYSYADYIKWPEDERWELINGVPYNMSPAPARKHQGISMSLSSKIFNFLGNSNCKVYSAPFDVRFLEINKTNSEDVFTVVQPDISVICDIDKLDDKGCVGAPDIVIEILSPSTSYKDEGEKLGLYELHGVKEYWIVNPEAQYVMIYRLNGSRFDKPDYYRDDEIIESNILDGLNLKLSEIWD